MNCQHFKQLLSLIGSKRQELDVPERDALEQHLAACPSCMAAAQTERRFDDAVGSVLRKVEVPAKLKENVLNRLAADRGFRPWRLPLAAAAAVLFLVTASLLWSYRPGPEVRLADIEYLVRNPQLDKVHVEQFFADQQVAAPFPGDFDDQHLKQINVIDFKGRRVAKLTFSNGECTANVLVLPWKQFRTNDVEKLVDPTAFEVRKDEEREVTYLIFFRGNIRGLYANRPPA